jgi:hypothetical protein
VKHGDAHALAATLLDDKAVRGLDILEVDRAEGGFQGTDDIGERSGSDSSSSISKQSMPANFLNSTALPSITGFAARAPMLPRPSTALPLETTATRLPRAVYRARRSGPPISRQASATPGE